jgi:membrane associated rhomboid family serine protease
MGIANRDYYRDNADSRWALENTPAVKILLILNVVIFILQIVVVRPFEPSDLKKHFGDSTPFDFEQLNDRDMENVFRNFPQVSVVQEYGELDVNRTVYKGQVWRVLTSAFLHSRTSFWHLVMNMLCLFWFGRDVELIYGSKEFTWFYLVSAILAGICFVGFSLLTKSSSSAIGASGAVMAVMMLFTMHYPRHIFNLFMVIPIEMRWVMAIYIAYDLHPLLLRVSGDQVFTGVAHAAHLGGVAFGYLYFRNQWRVSRFVPDLKNRRLTVQTLTPQRVAFENPIRLTEREELELDQLLEKIAKDGMSSLTVAERDRLLNASDRVKKNRGREPTL